MRGWLRGRLRGRRWRLGLEARSPGGVKIPLFLPSVVTRWERDPFSLASVNLDSVEALGRLFAEDNAPTLTRKALDAERDAEGVARVVIRDEVEQVVATQIGDAVRHDRAGPGGAVDPHQRGRSDSR
jgi:hypothetical protein